MKEINVLELLHDKIDDLMCDLQEQAGITDGGLDPILELDLDDAIEKLAKAVVSALEYQAIMKKYEGTSTQEGAI